MSVAFRGRFGSSGKDGAFRIFMMSDNRCEIINSDSTDYFSAINRL